MKNPEETIIENNQSQLRKGTLEYSVLLIIGRGQAYASDILKELKAANLIVVEGTLYPLLSRLKTSELLKYSWSESSSGPPRKYYALTDKGVETVKSLTQSWNSLNSSINHLIQAYEQDNKH